MSVVQLDELSNNEMAVVEECDTKWKAGYQLCGIIPAEGSLTLVFQLPVGANLSSSGGRLGPQPYAQAQQP